MPTIKEIVNDYDWVVTEGESEYGPVAISATDDGYGEYYGFVIEWLDEPEKGKHWYSFLAGVVLEEDDSFYDDIPEEFRDDFSKAYQELSDATDANVIEDLGFYDTYEEALDDFVAITGIQV